MSSSSLILPFFNTFSNTATNIYDRTYGLYKLQATKKPNINCI